MNWTTKAHVHMDKVACPWLIERSTDSPAEFIFTAADLVEKTAKEEGAIPFDIKGAELARHGERPGPGRTFKGSVIKLFFMLCVLFPVITAETRAASAETLKLLQKIPLPGVKGRIDHLAVDLNGGRLFVAALGNDTVEVIDLKSGKRVHTITGLSEPQGVVFVPEKNALYISNGGNGKCDVYNSATFEAAGNLAFSDDADNMRYQPASGRVYVGYGSGAIGLIDVRSGKKTGAIELPAHPEGFAPEADGNNIYVNLPSLRRIAVLGRKELKVKGTWPLKDAGGNFPMALDEAGHRLFTGCRSPARLLVFDTLTGKTVDELEIGKDADDIFYDAAKRRLYISCGGGFIDVIRQEGPSKYSLLQRIATAPYARTSLFVPEMERLYLAVPAHKRQGASIWVYEIE